jgi:hypothetical protein
MTTTAETITDETLKNSDYFYICSHQVMGTDEQVTSVTDNLAHNLSGENLNSRLSPLPNLNASDNLNDGENLQTKASLRDTPNGGENLKSRVSPVPTSTNTTIHETDGETLETRVSPEQSIIDAAHQSSKCSSTSQNQISSDQQITNVQTVHTVTDVTGVSTNIENISVPPLFDTVTSTNEQPLTENPTDMLTVLVETNTATKSKKRKGINLQKGMYLQKNIQKTLQLIIKILQLNKYQLKTLTTLQL